MQMQKVLYPRVLFRTSRAAGAVLITAFTVSLTGIVAMAALSHRPWTDFVILTVSVCIPSVLAFRILGVLASLERERSEPDAVMLLLFDLSLMLPTVSLMFMGYVMRLLR